MPAESQIRILDADEAAGLVADGATLFVGGSGGGLQEPTTLLEALGRRHQREGAPTELTVWHCSGLGDRASTGLNLLAIPSMLRRVVGGHWGMSPQLARLAIDGTIEAYNLPQGAIAQLLRDTAAGRAGLVTPVGVGTFVDPRLEGGRLNVRTTEDIVGLVELGGADQLFYPSFTIDVAFLRGTTVDEHGNVTLEDEAAVLDALPAAQATKARGGTVVVQAKQLAVAGSLDPRAVRVPGILVDAAVLDPEQPQTCLRGFDPALAGRLRRPLAAIPPMELSPRKVIARRAAAEVRDGDVVNLGVGIPDGVASVAAEDGWLDRLTFAIEQGHVGGVPVSGVEFGAAVNPEATIEQASQFDFFNGGGLDVAVLGMAQVDRHGNVNVSKYGDALSGCGGFIDISQGTRRVVFCGTLTSGGLQARFDNERLVIEREGRHRKLVRDVEQVTFSGPRAVEQGQEVLYVTERAVFRLTPDGLELIEVAPGVDPDREVLPLADFDPIVADPRPMRASHFQA